MTDCTVVRELFCCGSGKGGVMQNQGKENEYLPRLMPMVEGGNEHLDCVVGLWACLLPCAGGQQGLPSMLQCMSLRLHVTMCLCTRPIETHMVTRKRRDMHFNMVSHAGPA